MKKLILTLIRHASAANPAGVSDLDRPLSDEGRQEAAAMAERLAGVDTPPSSFLSSPARRALETSEILAEGVGLEPSRVVGDDALYEASVPDVLRVLQEMEDGDGSIAVCGHNPVTAELIQYLTLDFRGRVPPCTVARLELDAERWDDVRSGCAKLVSLDRPGGA